MREFWGEATPQDILTAHEGCTATTQLTPVPHVRLARTKGQWGCEVTVLYSLPTEVSTTNQRNPTDLSCHPGNSSMSVYGLPREGQDRPDATKDGCRRPPQHKL